MGELRGWGLVAAVVLLLAACGDLEEALTAHARPAAVAVGRELSADELGRIMAESPMPDSVLTGYWAGQIAQLWTDYVVLASLYMNPDTTRSVGYERLLEEQKLVATLAVARYRDSVVLRGVEPSEDEALEYFATRMPFTRVHMRRILIPVPADADEEKRDSLYRAAQQVRDQVAGGADFLEVARARSGEPPEARGQVLQYQGHEDFSPAVDSVVFRLRPGEISPVLVGDEGLLVIRVEARFEPEFERVRDQLVRQMVRERRETREVRAADSLVENARISVLRGAEEIARRIAADPAMEVDRVPARTRLVTYRGGDVTVDELRRVFQYRPDLERLFAESGEDDIRLYLEQLAADEVFVLAAERAGASPSREQRARLEELVGRQLATMAKRLKLSHTLVVNPAFDLDAESRGFVRQVLQRSRATPWLGEFRMVLDPQFPSRVDEAGAESAARRAREIRGGSAEQSDTPAEEPSIP